MASASKSALPVPSALRIPISRGGIDLSIPPAKGEGQNADGNKETQFVGRAPWPAADALVGPAEDTRNRPPERLQMKSPQLALDTAVSQLYPEQLRPAELRGIRQSPSRPPHDHRVAAIRIP